MTEQKLTREQKDILLAILCQTSINEEKLNDISEQVEFESDLEMLLQTATFAMHTAKTRLMETLLE